MKMESSFLYAKNKSPCFGLVNEGHEGGDQVFIHDLFGAKLAMKDTVGGPTAISSVA